MDVWIETVAGNLVKGSSITHIVVRHCEDMGTWEVSVSASAAPAGFAIKLQDEALARSIRNKLAVALSVANRQPEPQMITFEKDRQTVASYELAA